MPKLLGIEGGEGNFWERLWDVLVHLSETHLPTLIVGVACLLLLIWLERSFEKIPAALAALVFGIAISTAFGLEAHGVAVVGEIPAGLAPPRWPSIGLEQWGLLLPGAFGIALVAFAEAVAPARSFAAAHGYRIDPNQELIGLGAANTGAGLFQGFPIGASLSKSAANDRAGARTPMSLVVAAVATALVALFLTPLFTHLPEAALGAIVIVAVSEMERIGPLRRLWRLRRADFAPHRTTSSTAPRRSVWWPTAATAGTVSPGAAPMARAKALRVKVPPSQQVPRPRSVATRIARSSAYP